MFGGISKFAEGACYYLQTEDMMAACSNSGARVLLTSRRDWRIGVERMQDLLAAYLPYRALRSEAVRKALDEASLALERLRNALEEEAKAGIILDDQRRDDELTTKKEPDG